MHIRLFFVGLLSLVLAVGCGDEAAEGPSGAAGSGPGSISGSYNPDGVAAIISGQVLLQAAAEGAHNGTQVAVRGYASTAVTNAEGMFRLELILAQEDITRSDADADEPLSVEVLSLRLYMFVGSSIRVNSIYYLKKNICRCDYRYRTSWGRGQENLQIPVMDSGLLLQSLYFQVLSQQVLCQMYDPKTRPGFFD